MSHLGDAPWWCAAIGAAAAGVVAVAMLRAGTRARWYLAFA